MRVSWLLTLALVGACSPAERAADPPAEMAADTLPAFRAWRLSAQGVGPLLAGMSAADAVLATGGTLSVPPLMSPEQCDYASWDAAPAGLTVMFEDGILVRVDVTAAGIATAEGLEVGQSAARADSLYAAVAVRSPHKYEEGEYLVVRPLAPTDTVHRLVVELVGGSVKRFRVGRAPQVEYVEGCS